MSENKLIIIEDEQIHWKYIREAVESFADVYPANDAEFDEFKQAFLLLSKNPRDKDRQKKFMDLVNKAILGTNKVAFIVDLNLTGKSKDASGEWIATQLLADYASSTCLLTAYSASLVDKPGWTYFRKFDEGEYNIEIVIKNNILPWVFRMFDLDINEIQPFFSTRRKTKSSNDVGKNHRFAVPKIIHGCIKFFFGAGAVLISYFTVRYIMKSANEVSGIVLVEYAFLIFLPFIIIMGFFAFYKNAIRRFIFDEPSRSDEDMEHAPDLIHQGKIMFISTLISYLILKIVEMLLRTEPFKPELSRDDFYRILGLSACIVFLLFYYKSIHHNNNDSGHKSE